ncbi:hypothetical protein CK203_063196 [Vitis vinifera]|uniref:Uncharacterized protein n=1 Tax=Vitis vinifera TaxID=29760 RepID=A0A438FQB0_VITVI|nr:hypothetical protein CK203_063196 [Vitis vinifera]
MLHYSNEGALHQCKVSLCITFITMLNRYAELEQLYMKRSKERLTIGGKKGSKRAEVHGHQLDLTGLWSPDEREKEQNNQLKKNQNRKNQEFFCAREEETGEAATLLEKRKYENGKKKNTENI